MATTGNLVMESFFPQHAGNLGREPLMHLEVEGHDTVPGEVETDGRGKAVVFDHHVLEDDSSSDGLDTCQLYVVGELTAKVG